MGAQFNIINWEKPTHIHYSAQQIFYPLKQDPPVNVPLPSLSLRWLISPCQMGRKDNGKYLSQMHVQPSQAPHKLQFETRWKIEES